MLFGGAAALVCLLAALVWLLMARQRAGGSVIAGAEPKYFKFETVELAASGREMRRSEEQAEYFTEDLGDGVNLDMVKVGGGSFTMGSPQSEKDRKQDEDQHSETVQTFYIGKFEVTQAQWKAVASTPQVEQPLSPEPEGFKGGDLPANNVSWFDAVEFCARLSKMTGRKYRLPTEAEWEYACRAGSTKPFGLGETITKKVANFHGETGHDSSCEERHLTTIKSVGSAGVANGYGLFDMHGNLQEWSQDVKREDGTEFRALRGGGWGSAKAKCRCAFREWGSPKRREDIFGFRVVVWVPGP
jgi:formylglycine-generating enzyme required for sulfatase activity